MRCFCKFCRFIFLATNRKYLIREFCQELISYNLLNTIKNTLAWSDHNRSVRINLVWITFSTMFCQHITLLYCHEYKLWYIFLTGNIYLMLHEYTLLLCCSLNIILFLSVVFGYTAAENYGQKSWLIYTRC